MNHKVPRYVGVVKKVVEKMCCCTAGCHKYPALVGSRLLHSPRLGISHGSAPFTLRAAGAFSKHR